MRQTNVFGIAAFTIASASGALLSGCASDAADDDDDDALVSAEQAITAIGDPLPGIAAADFAAARTAFVTVEEIEDGVGPVFNEKACGNCHTQGSIGGAGVQIERRFGRFVNGAFDDLGNRGGSLRQLMTVGTFTSASGRQCTVPLEVEPREATVRNVGRLTTPLFGLGLVDAMPDSFFTGMAASQPIATRGIANIVSTVLPNDRDVNQRIGGQRVGRFGWKAGVPNLLQFSADAYLNEMGITTQSCFQGVSVTAFATES